MKPHGAAATMAFVRSRLSTSLARLGMLSHFRGRFGGTRKELRCPSADKRLNARPFQIVCKSQVP